MQGTYLTSSVILLFNLFISYPPVPPPFPPQVLEIPFGRTGIAHVTFRRTRKWISNVISSNVYPDIASLRVPAAKGLCFRFLLRVFSNCSFIILRICLQHSLCLKLSIFSLSLLSG
jgi:hypothetical protein